MTDSLDQILERHRQGDPQALDLLCEYAMERLLAIVNRLLPRNPAVARWDRPSDIRQDAAIRLLTALKDVQPESERHLLNLAAMQVRRELADKARKHGGHGRGLGNLEEHAVPGGPMPVEETSTGAGTLEDWGIFHRCVDNLPELEQEVFSMRWYLGAKEQTIADILGVSRSTVQRAFRAAVAKIKECLGRRPPS